MKRKIEELKMLIPDLKRGWVNEFLNTAYKNKSVKTKLRFLMDVIRLLNYLKDVSFEKYYGGWNIIEATDVEDCQVHTGILKDSLRIFFRWLLNRKNTTYDLSDAIPTQTKNIRVSKVTGNLIKSLYNKWNYTECELEERIAGLLVMYYGSTNAELRYLKNEDFKNGKMKIRGHYIELESKLSNLINEYLDFKVKRFFGVNTTYFFVTAYSISKDAPVGIGHFSKLFKSRNIGVSPSDLRKAMIYFHKNSDDADPFYISSLFGIRPRGAARYFER